MAERLAGRAVARRGLVLFHCTALVQVAYVAVYFITVIVVVVCLESDSRPSSV